jgi:hypothetical protein
MSLHLASPKSLSHFSLLIDRTPSNPASSDKRRATVHLLPNFGKDGRIPNLKSGSALARLSQANLTNELARADPSPYAGPEQHHPAWLGETENGNLKELLVPSPLRPDANVGNFSTGKQRGSLMIYHSGNPFSQSQHRRRPMRLNSFGSRGARQIRAAPTAYWRGGAAGARPSDRKRLSQSMGQTWTPQSGVSTASTDFEPSLMA